MKRPAVISACLVSLVTLLAGSGAVAAQPSPSPGADTRQVCERSGKTMEDGVKSFTAELDKAGSAATGGDLATAERHVKQSGTVLTELSGKLREDSEQARDQELRSAIDDVAAEVQTLGSGLTGIAALQDLDTTRLESLTERVARICGAN